MSSVQEIIPGIPIEFTHFVNLRKIIHHLGNNPQIEMTIWSYGREFTSTVPYQEFLNNYDGAIIATPPLSNMKKNILSSQVIHEDEQIYFNIIDDIKILETRYKAYVCALQERLSNIYNSKYSHEMKYQLMKLAIKKIYLSLLVYGGINVQPGRLFGQGSKLFNMLEVFIIERKILGKEQLDKIKGLPTKKISGILKDIDIEANRLENQDLATTFRTHK